MPLLFPWLPNRHPDSQTEGVTMREGERDGGKRGWGEAGGVGREGGEGRGRERERKKNKPQ